uniref:Extensin-like n=1 Tax=Parastrongyloides trichosuri TaxID=131310 RepID=A0A0N4ZDL5_PARTI
MVYFIKNYIIFLWFITETSLQEGLQSNHDLEVREEVSSINKRSFIVEPQVAAMPIRKPMGQQTPRRPVVPPKMTTKKPTFRPNVTTKKTLTTIRRPFPMTTRRQFPMTTRRPLPMTTRRPFPMTTRRPFPMTTRRPLLTTKRRPLPMTTRRPLLTTTRRPPPRPTTSKMKPDDEESEEVCLPDDY